MNRVQTVTPNNVDDLLIRVAAEAPRTVSHAVRIPDPEAVRAAVERGPMRLSELQQLPATTGIRTTRYRHILGAPVPREELDDWMRRWPDHPLPEDLRALCEL